MRRHDTGYLSAARRGRYLRTGRTGIVAVAIIALVAFSGCGSKKTPTVTGKGGGVSVSVTPADNATDVPVSSEIGLQVSGGTITGVELLKADGSKVAGALRADHSTWVPDDPLSYTTSYTATVTAAGGDGKAVTRSTKFTTMARPADNTRIATQLYMDNGKTYGQAMPIVVEFQGGKVSSAADRAAVERRFFVTTEPAQPGVWHWDSDIQVEYRAEHYWQPGTKIKVRLGLGGLPMGGGKYGQFDISIAASIDTVKRVMTVDNASKTLTATQDDQVVRVIPVSLGKPEKPSFSGTMVIMSRDEKTLFDSSTYGTPVNSPDGYKTEVQFAERLTYDGQFIHAAPWSVAQQGHTNVSHGCVNMATDNAQFIYTWVKVGDPVVVSGTEEHLGQGNGWTAWDLSWEDFIKGSALIATSTASPKST